LFLFYEASSNNHRRADQFRISERAEMWTTTFYEDFFCGILKKNPQFPGKSSQSAAVTQNCTPFPKFASGLPKSVNWVPGDGLRLALFKDELCTDKPVFQDQGCIQLGPLDPKAVGSTIITAFSVVNSTSVSTTSKNCGTQV